MDEEPIATLVGLGDAGRMVADPAEDIRGRTVRDSVGSEIGTVDELLVDTVAGKVRFLRVAHGGILGFGVTHAFIPVDAVGRVDADEVVITPTRQQVADAPRYDPDLVDEREFYGTVYGHYGYPPFWGPGYSYPGFPYYP